MNQVVLYNLSGSLSICDNPTQLNVGRSDNRFYYFVLLAMFLHSILLLSISATKPRRLGSLNGVENAISVSLINSQDINSRSTVEDQSAGSISQSVPEPKEEPRSKSLSEQSSPKEKSDNANQENKNVSASKKNPTTEIPFYRPEVPDLQDKPKEETSTERTNPESLNSKSKIPIQKSPQPSNNEAKKLANLDLSPPKVFVAPSGGGGAGVQRPPGITRSGENDDFARGVIRALQQTMPQLRDTYGRVTVRIILDKNGGLSSTDILNPSKISGLDQSVVFATRQTSFPLPPLNSNSADLTFIVTYIYR